MIGTQFRRFSFAMGFAVIVLTAALLYMQSRFQAGLTTLQDDFMPHWQTAQRLQGDVQSIGAKASQLTLAFTLGELQSMRGDLDEQVKSLEASLQDVLHQTDNAELAQNLTVATNDFHRTADDLAEAVRLRDRRADLERQDLDLHRPPGRARLTPRRAP